SRTSWPSKAGRRPPPSGPTACWPAPWRRSGGSGTGLERLHPIDVAHLAAGLGLPLAVEVDPGLRLGGVAQPRVRLVAQQVQHLHPGDWRGRAERPAGDGADMLLELVDLAAVER